MKKIIFTLLSLLLYVSNFAQPYQSIFGKEKTKFSIATPITVYKDNPNLLGPVWTSGFETTAKDTVTIHGLLYEIFNSYIDPNTGAIEGYGYVREDTMTGKIYRYIPDLEEEFLICDMTLSAGDTFQLPIFFDYDPSWNYFYREQGYNAVVKQIDTIGGRKIIEFYDIPSETYSFFYNDDPLHYRELNIYLKFIEGIGPIYGPLGYLNGYTGQEYTLGAVLCVHRDDTLFYMTSELLGCGQYYVKIDKFESSVIRIYPNPVNDLVSIEIGDNKTGGKLFILNSMGMVVYQESVNRNVVTLNVSHLLAGFYAVFYETEKERIVSKFIKIK